MDNTAKAFVIAGAILITIMLISVTMYLFGIVKGIAGVSAAQTYNTQVEAFNRFFIYSKLEGDVKLKGSDVYNIIGKAIDVNQNEWSLGKIEVNYLGANYTDYTVEQIKNVFYENDKLLMKEEKFLYTYSINPENGLVCKIVFTTS